MVQNASAGTAVGTPLRDRLRRRDRGPADRDCGNKTSPESSASMKTRDHITHDIRWLDSGREPQCQPSPAYPDGIDVPSPRPAAKRIGSLASSSCQVPNSFGPGIRRSIVDQPFLYAALPPPLIPFVDLMPPVGGQHLFRCPLQIIGAVGGADGMIFAAKRVSAVSARSENVLLQARDISDVISLRPFKSGAASRPVDREEQPRSEVQSCVLVPFMPFAIGYKRAVVRCRGPLRQAVLDVVQQYLRDRYLEAIRHCVGWYLHCVE